jgi:ATP-dependent Clp protease ATP-binding subunit ClpX
VAIANHYRRAVYQGPVPIKKGNVLLVGTTGSGKTMMIRSVAELLDVPFHEIAAPAITQQGFAGMDPETVLEKLIEKAGKEKARFGIAYIDEIDKIAKKPSDETDASKNLPTGLAVQQALLDLIEARVVNLRRGGNFDASQVLFIFSGAFVGIERVVHQRLSVVGKPMDMDMRRALALLEPSDLIGYGMIPEFVGRCPEIVTLRPLRPEDLYQILTVPLGALVRQKQALASVENATLDVSATWLRTVANEAYHKGTGARALEEVTAEVWARVFYDLRDGDAVRISDGGEVSKAAPAAMQAARSSTRDAGPQATEAVAGILS